MTTAAGMSTSAPSDSTVRWDLARMVWGESWRMWFLAKGTCDTEEQAYLLAEEALAEWLTVQLGDIRKGLAHLTGAELEQAVREPDDWFSRVATDIGVDSAMTFAPDAELVAQMGEVEQLDGGGERKRYDIAGLYFLVVFSGR